MVDIELRRGAEVVLSALEALRPWPFIRGALQRSIFDTISSMDSLGEDQASVGEAAFGDLGAAGAATVFGDVERAADLSHALGTSP